MATQTKLKKALITPEELRVGTQLYYDTGEGIEITSLDWQDIEWVSKKPRDFNNDHSPITLTESLLSKVRCSYRDGGSRIEFKCSPPGERQAENNYWSHEVSDFRILHLSPSYTRKKVGDEWVKPNEPDFWFVWICAHGTGSNWFLSLTDIHGKSTIKYFHQLQTLYYVLTGLRLFLPFNAHKLPAHESIPSE